NSPFSRLARASLTGAVRRMLPTWSARNGGLVLCVITSSATGPLVQRVLIAASHSTAGAVPSCGGFACIACGFKRAAERKIMRRDITQVGRCRKRFDDTVRSDMADETTGNAGNQPAQRRSHAATPGVAKQRGHARWPCHADFYRLADAARADPPEPAQNPFGRERKLTDNMDAQALRGRGCDFLVERRFQTPRRNTQ